jgi:hypothetical protein
MKTDSARFHVGPAPIANSLGLTRAAETSMRNYPAMIQSTCIAARTPLDVVNQLFNNAVQVEGLQPAAVQNAWKLISNFCDASAPFEATISTASRRSSDDRVCSIYTMGRTAMPSPSNSPTVIFVNGGAAHCGLSVHQADLSRGVVAFHKRTRQVAEVKSDDKPADHEQNRSSIGHTAAWVGFANSILGGSRLMTKEEHTSAIEAIWAEIDDE